MLWDLLWPSVWLERDQERESQRERGSSLNPPVSRYIFLRLSVWEDELIARTVCLCFNSKFWIFLQSSPRTVCIFIGLSLPTTPYGTMLMHHLLNRPQMPWSRRDFATVLQLAQNRHNTGLFLLIREYGKAIALNWSCGLQHIVANILKKNTMLSLSRAP